MIQSFRITSASVSDRGLNEKRPHNEDAFLEIPQSGIFAVADGVGGAQAGEVASQMAVEVLGEAFVNVDDRSDAEDVMRTALMRANSAINQMSHELPQLAQMATTVVALHIAGNIATIGHAGDSRLYRLDAEGTLHRETADHSMVADEVRAGRMTEEQAENHPGKNIISRALGAEPSIEIELKTIMFGENTTFLICSDGVTRHVPDTELAELLRSGAEPREICERIKELCFARGAQDNLTAVIVRLGAAEQSHQIEVSQGHDEVTVATARPAASAISSDENDDDDLLEIETGRLTPLAYVNDEPDVFAIPGPPVARSNFDPEPATILQETSPQAASEAVEESVREEWPPTASVLDTRDVIGPTDDEPVATDTPQASEEVKDEYETAAAIPLEEHRSELPAPIASAETVSASEPDFVILGNNGDEGIDEKPRSGFAGKMFRSVLLLLLGSIFGLAGYHYFLMDRSAPAAVQLPEMKSNNQPQTSFEENRRSLDKNPEAALALFEKEPKDGENRFLVGRAYLLLGKFPEARKAFVESRERIAAGEVDPSNAKTILTEIAIAMTVTNDPQVQGNLKKELEDPKAQTGPAPSGNSNAKAPANAAANGNAKSNR